MVTKYLYWPRKRRNYISWGIEELSKRNWFWHHLLLGLNYFSFDRVYNKCIVSSSSKVYLTSRHATSCTYLISLDISYHRCTYLISQDIFYHSCIYNILSQLHLSYLTGYPSSSTYLISQDISYHSCTYLISQDINFCTLVDTDSQSLS